MSVKHILKRGIVKTLKKTAPIIDPLLSKPIIKGPMLKVSQKLISRYSLPTSIENDFVSSTQFTGPWVFSLDTPKKNKQSKKEVYISGWFSPTGGKKAKFRLVSPEGQQHPIKTEILRDDVSKAFKKKGKIVNARCGFELKIDLITDGDYFFEALIYKTTKWRKVHKLNLFFDPDFLPGDTFNPQLAANFTEHLNLLENKKEYFYEEDSKKQFKLSTADPKLVAFYLPQFHRIKENDTWWGEGFTEWTNVASASPRFTGHEQPKIPSSLGFYDLENKKNIHEQINLAKKHGIYGFCFYYYWFSGHRLLEKPLDIFLKNKQWDFNFMICWANENWTRRWDGRNEDILIAQEHKQSDPMNFIKDVEHILLDPRYIRVDNRPVLLVYRAKDLLEPRDYADKWRQYFKDKHDTDLHLVAVQSFSFDNPQSFNFDKGLEFVPLSIASALDGPLPQYDIRNKIIDTRFSGSVHDYREIALRINENKQRFPTYKCVMPAWDNDARKKGAGGIFYNSNPDIYGRWLKDSITSSIRQRTGNLVFINAWNEWAEGAYLEPDSIYGHAYLNRTSEVLAQFSGDDSNKENFPIYSIRRRPGVKLAVVIHLYYADLWDTFKQRLSVMKEHDFDLFVSLPIKNSNMADKISEFKPDSYIFVVPNRGRDVLPFVHISRRLKELGYEYVLKLHSKKSRHREDGLIWLKDMLEKLIPEETLKFNDLMAILSKKNTAVIGPEGHFVSLNTYFGLNRENIRAVLRQKIGSREADRIVRRPDKYGFFAGTMFWARLDAFTDILDQYYQMDDFDSEKGQLDGTFAHALERLFCLLPEFHGKKLYTIDAGGTVIKEVPMGEKGTTEYQFAQNQ